MPDARKGARMGDSTIVDMTLGILSDTFGSGHMGITAENVAAKQGYRREDLDRFVEESHRRACTAIENGYVREAIVPGTVQHGRKE